MSNEARLTIKINDLNEHCPQLINSSADSYLFISRDRFPSKSSEKLTHQFYAFDKDISDQFNITFELVPSLYSTNFHLTSTGLLKINELPLKLPSIIELDYLLKDTFTSEPCLTKDKFIILIGNKQTDRDRLIDEYNQQIQLSKQQYLITQKLSIQKRKKQETILMFLTFTISTLIIVIGLFTLLFIFCCRTKNKRNSQRSIATKSSSLINPSLLDDSKQPSPHSFITDLNGKSSLLPTLR